jgi:hypothetical protein
MAVTLKRKRGAVSYREASSDEDTSDSASQEGQVRQKRAPPSRRLARRNESPPPPQVASRPADRRPAVGTRNSRRQDPRKISYKDASTDDDDDDDPDADFEVSEAEAPPRAKTRRAAVGSPKPRSPRPAKGTTTRTSSKGRSHQKLVVGAPRKPNVSEDAATVVRIPTDGNKPAWTSLPYHVLLQIFVYASHPLSDENMKPTTSISWLVQAACMCSAFTKPALTALYRNPPLFAMKQRRKDLVHHLISPPAGGQEDHRVMVKRLEFDATQMSALTDHAHSVADLASLIRALTTLREIDIFDPIDRPPFRGRLRQGRRWVYPSELFEALRDSEIRLRSWRWNSTYCDHGPLWLKTIHGDASFRTLRELTLTKFHPVEIRHDRDEREDAHGQPTTEELIASALVTLPNLKSLSFETCGIVSGRLLPLLPPNLVSLSITNCGELLSDVLQAFLATHGAHLEDLVLNHNQSLDLSFLVDLKLSCPRLEILRMDTTYYSSLSMSSDNEPLYETLLGETEKPTWPSTLRVLDMEYLRKWNSVAATNFFGSLIDAASELPWLQEIIIVTMVDTDWRQRAEFRRKWTDQFRKVFARAWKSPSSHLASARAYREWKANPKPMEREAEVEKNDSLIECVPEVANDIKLVDSASESDSDSDAPLLASRKQKQDERWGSKRLRSRSKAATSYDESSANESGSSSEEEEGPGEEKELFVQGRCHTVLFRIDNFRPREEIYGEADFLDAEPSGDEEWNGNDDQEDEGGYAW